MRLKLAIATCLTAFLAFIPLAGGITPYTDITTLEPYSSGAGVFPTFTGGQWTTKTTSSGISRLHYTLNSTPIGENEPFVFGGTFKIISPARGTVLRIEGETGGRNRLEIDRWSDGSYHLVRNHYGGGGDEYVSIGDLPALPVGTNFDLAIEATLSRTDGQALTVVKLNGAEVLSTTAHNWSNVPGELVERVRFGIVDGQSAGEIKVINAYVDNIASAEPTIEELQTEIAALTAQVSALTAQVSALSVQISSLSTQLTTQTALTQAETARADAAETKLQQIAAIIG